MSKRKFEGQRVPPLLKPTLPPEDPEHQVTVARESPETETIETPSSPSAKKQTLFHWSILFTPVS